MTIGYDDEFDYLEDNKDSDASEEKFAPLIKGSSKKSFFSEEDENEEAAEEKEE